MVAAAFYLLNAVHICLRSHRRSSKTIKTKPRKWHLSLCAVAVSAAAVICYSLCPPSHLQFAISKKKTVRFQYLCVCRFSHFLNELSHDITFVWWIIIRKSYGWIYWLVTTLLVINKLPSHQIFLCIVYAFCAYWRLNVKLRRRRCCRFHSVPYISQSIAVYCIQCNGRNTI